MDKPIYECDCDCHTNPAIKHFAPCCIECPNCGKNIKLVWCYQHGKDCKPKDEKVFTINVKKPTDEESQEIVKSLKEQFRKKELDVEVNE